MPQNQRHKRRNKKGLNRFFKGFLNDRLLLVLGVLFLMTGLYYSFTSSDLSRTIYNTLMNLFKPSADKATVIAVDQGLTTLLLYFLPAGFVLIFSGLFARKYSSITYPISLIIAFYLIVIQIKVYSNVTIGDGNHYYQNFLEASVFLLSTSILLLITAFLHRKYVLLILTCFYFYITVVLYAAVYADGFKYLFSFVLIFSSFIAWIGTKMERIGINFINFLFAIGFFSLFMLRKFIANSKPELLNVYFIFAALFYIFFYLILILSSNTKEQSLGKWMQLVMNWLNLLFFLCSTSFIILRYYTYDYLWILVIVFALFNLVGLFIMKKYTPTLWLIPYYSALILLTALILPLIVQQDRIFLFLSGISVFTLIYAEWFKDRAVLWISFIALVVTIGFYFYLWADNYLASLLIAHQVIPQPVLLWNGLLTGVVLLVVLCVTRWRLNVGKLPLLNNKFTSTEYNQFIYTFLLLTVFLTLGWFVFGLECYLTGTGIYSSVGWFISGSIFFIFLIQSFSGKRSKFKRPLLYLAFLQIILFPLFLGWNITKENLIHSGSLNMNALFLHYLAIILLVGLGTMTIRRIYQRNTKHVTFLQGVQLVVVVYLGFLLSTEYDNLTVLVAFIENSSNTGFIIGTNILNSNQYLPFSITMGVLSVIIFIFAFLKHHLFLRGCSLVLFTGIVVKIFAYDFQTMVPAEKSSVFIALGVFLIAFALLYPRLVKKVPLAPPDKNRDKLRGGREEKKNP